MSISEATGVSWLWQYHLLYLKIQYQKMKLCMYHKIQTYNIIFNMLLTDIYSHWTPSFQLGGVTKMLLDCCMIFFTNMSVTGFKRSKKTFQNLDICLPNVSWQAKFIYSPCSQWLDASTKKWLWLWCICYTLWQTFCFPTWFFFQLRPSKQDIEEYMI
jgi:hypothetical protein